MTNSTADPAPFDMGLYVAQATAFWHQTVHWISINGLRIAVAVAIGAVLVAIMLGIRMLAIRFCRSRYAHGNWPVAISRAAIKTHILFMVAVAARLVSGYAEPPTLVATTITFFFTIGTTLQAAVWARELVLSLVEGRAGDMDDHSSLGSAIGLIRLLVTFILFAIATLMILDNLGVNVTGLIAGLGIGGIAIGLAAKGIFDDLFSALSIIFDKPFRRGDTIKWDSTVGSVEAIGLKTTRIRANTGEEVVVSNTNLLDKELHNLARIDHRRQVLAVGVTYQTSPDQLDRVIEIIRSVVEDHEHCSLAVCGIKDFGASSIDYDVQFDIGAEAPPVPTKHAICVGILRAFAAEGIELAYPTQVSFTAAPDGSMVMPYADAHQPEPARA
jgi:small-conductance mechanosensitive channel